MRTWIIGSSADCDLVIERSTVSGRHCRLIEGVDGYFLEDLGSSNGTYVNGVRIASATRVSRTDAVTLGVTVPMRWPEADRSPGPAPTLPPTVLRIGRDADNDVVLDDPRVSGHHARLVITGWGEARIEDLGSTNGTFLNSSEQRMTQAVPLTESDVVHFGSLAVPAARLLAAGFQPSREDLPPGPSLVPEPTAEFRPQPILVSSASTPTAIDPWTLLLLVQAPVLAILIVLAFGRQPAAPITAASRASVAEAVAATTFALAVSAVWSGAFLAVWELAARRSPSRLEGALAARFLVSPGARLASLGAIFIAQCAAMLAIARLGGSLKGPWPATLGILVLASAAGLSLGLVVSSLVRTPATTLAVLVLSFLPMFALGGWIRPLSALSPALRPAAAVMPARWAFEGLLLIESEADPPPILAGSGTEPDSDSGPGSRPDRGLDLAEDFFPMAAERMGTRADAMALGFLAIGLAAAAAFIAWSSTPGP